MPTDLAAVHLREAVHQMGLITGETASEDMLDRIFADFCIGK
jgi:tRNA modification GTPase